LDVVRFVHGYFIFVPLIIVLSIIVCPFDHCTSQDYVLQDNKVLRQNFEWLNFQTPFIGLQMYSGRLDEHDWWYAILDTNSFYRQKTVLVSPWLCCIASLTYLPTTQAWKPLASAPPESGSFCPVSRFSPIPVRPGSFRPHLLIVL
jgi:hypothetical protein